MSLADFEARMLKLKGIKLPAVSLIGTDPAKQAKVTPNPLFSTLLSDDPEEEYEIDHELDDILVGVVRSFDVADSHKGNKLTVAALRSILNKLPMISTPAIIDNFSYKESQARHYARACRMVIQFKSRHDVRQSFKQLSNYVE